MLFTWVRRYFFPVQSLGSFQATAFFLGALSDMPAVRAFALYAAVSLTFNFILQITCFVAAMALDARFKFCALLAEHTPIFSNPKLF